MNTAVWAGDWRERVARRVRSLGYESVTALLEARPGIPYEAIADLLGNDVAAVQVARIHAESTPAPDLEAASRDSLARFLNASLPKRGWGVGPYWRAGVAGAFAPWHTTWEGRLANVDMTKLMERLFALDPPVGWHPQAGNDPYLVALFGTSH